MRIVRERHRWPPGVAERSPIPKQEALMTMHSGDINSSAALPRSHNRSAFRFGLKTLFAMVFIGAIVSVAWSLRFARTESQLMHRGLYESVRVGQSLNEVQASIGQGKSMRAEQVPDYLAQLIARRWPGATIEDDDEFLFYSTRHSSKIGTNYYLQFRDGKLINFDERDYEMYDVSGPKLVR